MNPIRLSLHFLREHFWNRRRYRYGFFAVGGSAVIAFLLVELWLIPRAATRLEQALASLGYHISYRDPDLELWRGRLALKDFTLHRSPARDKPLVFVSDFGIDINLKELISTKLLEGQATIRHGRVILYGEARQTDFEDLSAEFDFDSHSVHIKRFSGASSLGYQVDLVGKLVWGSPAGERSAETAPARPPDSGADKAPSAADSTPPADQFSESVADLVWLDDLATLLACEPLGDELVDLQLELDWDGTKPNLRRDDGSEINSQLRVQGRLLGADVAWKGFPLERLDATFQLVEWELKVPSMTFTTARGELGIAGHYELDSSRLIVEKVASTIDPIRLVSSLVPALAEPLSRLEYDTMPALAGEELTIDFADLASSEIEIQIEAPEGIRYRESPEATECIELGALRGSVGYGRGSELRISDLEARVNGLELRGQMRLEDFPPAPAPPQPGEGGQVGDRPMTAAVRPGTGTGSLTLPEKIAHLLQIDCDHARLPLLELDLVASVAGAGETSWLRDVHVSGNFSGAEFSWNDQEIESAKVEFGFHDGQLEIGHIQLAGLGGKLRASGSYNFASRLVRIPELSSTADLKLMREKLGFKLPGLLDSIEYPAPPRIMVNDLELHMGESPRGRGRLEFFAEQGFSVSEGAETLIAKSFDLALNWEAPQLLRIERAAGMIGGLEFNLGGALRWRAPILDQIAGYPGGGSAIAPWTVPGAAAASPAPGQGNPEPSILGGIVDYLSFTANRNPVRLEGRIEWDETVEDPAGAGASSEVSAWRRFLKLDATISGEAFVWRGFDIVSSSSRVRIENGELHFNPYRIDTTDGSFESQGVYELGENRLRIQSLRSTMDPFVTLDRFGFPLRELEAWIDFQGSPLITGEEITLDLDEPGAMSGQLRKEGSAGIALTLPGGRTLLIAEPRGSLRFGDGVFETAGVTAKVLDGDARISLSVAPFDQSLPYSLAVGLDAVSIEAASDWMDPGNPFDEAGTIHLAFDGKGTGTIESIAGSGRARVGAEDGSAHHLPLLRGLLSFIDGGYQKNWSLDLPFTVADGKVETAAARLDGHRVSVHLTGSLDWIHDRVDVEAGVNLRGLAGVVTSIASPLRSDFIEIVGRGAIEDVEWGPRREMERRSRHQARRQNLAR